MNTRWSRQSKCWIKREIKSATPHFLKKREIQNDNLLCKNKNSFPRNKRVSLEHPNTREIPREKVIFAENNKWQETVLLGITIQGIQNYTNSKFRSMSKVHRISILSKEASLTLLLLLCFWWFFDLISSIILKKRSQQDMD